MNLQHFQQTTYNENHHLHPSSWIPIVMVLYSILGDEDPQVSGLCCQTKARHHKRQDKKSQCNKYKSEDSDMKHGASTQQWQGMIKQEEESGTAVAQQRIKLK
jgi:hypothetical protein